MILQSSGSGEPVARLQHVLGREAETVQTARRPTHAIRVFEDTGEFFAYVYSVFLLSIVQDGHIIASRSPSGTGLAPIDGEQSVSPPARGSRPGRHQASAGRAAPSSEGVQRLLHNHRQGK